MILVLDVQSLLGNIICSPCQCPKSRYLKSTVHWLAGCPKSTCPVTGYQFDTLFKDVLQKCIILWPCTCTYLTSVDASDAGAGNLEVIVRCAKDGSRIANLLDATDRSGRFRIFFTPRAHCYRYKVDVTFNDEQIPGAHVTFLLYSTLIPCLSSVFSTSSHVAAMSGWAWQQFGLHGCLWLRFGPNVSLIAIWT